MTLAERINRWCEQSYGCEDESHLDLLSEAEEALRGEYENLSKLRRISELAVQLRWLAEYRDQQQSADWHAGRNSGLESAAEFIEGILNGGAPTKETS